MTPEQEQQVLEALYDRLYDAVTYAPGGKDSAFPKNVYFQMAKNTVLNPADFADMMSPVNPMGDQTSSEYFSRMVDALPAPGALWGDSKQKLTQFVTGTLAQAITTLKPDPEQQATYDAAYNFLNTTTETTNFKKEVTKKTDPSDIAIAYKKAQAAYVAAVSGYRTSYNGYNLKDKADQRAWNASAPVLQNLVDSTWDDWERSGKAEVEEAQEALASTINNAVSYAISEQRRVTGGNYTLPANTPGGYPWFPSYAMPTNWADDDVTGPKLELSSSNLTQTESSASHTYGLAASGSYLGFHATVGVDGEHKEQSSHMKADSLKLSAELIAVNIVRPWFNSLLLGMTGWKVLGQARGSFSNGDPLKPAGLVPLIPVGFVVARNVSITANFAEDDKKFISDAVNTSVEGGWGPFTLKAKYGFSKSDSTATATLDGGTLTFPGLQLIAWISTVPPLSPPESG